VPAFPLAVIPSGGILGVPVVVSIAVSIFVLVLVLLFTLVLILLRAVGRGRMMRVVSAARGQGGTGSDSEGRQQAYTAHERGRMHLTPPGAGKPSSLQIYTSPGAGQGQAYASGNKPVGSGYEEGRRAGIGGDAGRANSVCYGTELGSRFRKIRIGPF